MNWFHFQNLKKQRIAEAAVDSLKQQMAELCRSETLSRARQQHDQDLTVKREQHNAAVGKVNNFVHNIHKQNV
jgi:hypothetical protein